MKKLQESINVALAHSSDTLSRAIEARVSDVEVLDVKIFEKIN